MARLSIIPRTEKASERSAMRYSCLRDRNRKIDNLGQYPIQIHFYFVERDFWRDQTDMVIRSKQHHERSPDCEYFRDVRKQWYGDRVDKIRKFGTELLIQIYRLAAAVEK